MAKQTLNFSPLQQISNHSLLDAVATAPNRVSVPTIALVHRASFHFVEYIDPNAPSRWLLVLFSSKAVAHQDSEMMVVLHKSDKNISTPHAAKCQSNQIPKYLAMLSVIVISICTAQKIDKDKIADFGKNSD